MSRKNRNPDVKGPEAARRRIFEVIEIASDNDWLSKAYDIIMMVTILTSLVPLAFTKDLPAFHAASSITAMIFIIDYVLRLLTADFKLKKGVRSFFFYPLTPMALLDLICILSVLPSVSSSFRVLKVLRLLGTFRVIKAFRYSRSVSLFVKIFREEKEALGMVAGIAVLYILFSALLILNLEPETFGNYLNAVYWASVTLTTIGYGDLAPVTAAGKFLTIVSSFVGVAIVAMPTGIIASGLLREVGKRTDDDPANDNDPYLKDKDRFSVM